MIENIDKELIEIKTKINEKENLEHKLEAARLELQKLHAKKAGLKTQLLKEQKDVKSLEKLTLKSIWYSFIGSRNEKLRNEREELSKVEYEYHYLNDIINRLQSEIDYYIDKINNLKHLESQYETLLKQKETMIYNNNHELYEPLTKLNQEIINLEANIKEINEALIAGKEVINALEEIKKALNSASGWGTWDLLGGGLFSDLMKHSKLDEAERKIRDLQYLLNKYNRELKDINMHININLDISSTLKFFDFFFDNIFSDLMVHSKIQRALEQINNAYRIINNQLSELDIELKRNTYNIKQIYNQKKQLLTPNKL